MKEYVFGGQLYWIPLGAHKSALWAPGTGYTSWGGLIYYGTIFNLIVSSKTLPYTIWFTRPLTNSIFWWISLNILTETTLTQKNEWIFCICVKISTIWKLHIREHSPDVYWKPQFCRYPLLTCMYAQDRKWDPWRRNNGGLGPFIVASLWSPMVIKLGWGGICFDWKDSIEIYMKSELMKFCQKLVWQKINSLTRNLAHQQ